MPNRKTQQHGPERFFLTPAPPGRSPLRSTAPSTRAILLFPAVLTFFFACGCDTFPFPAQSSRTPPDVPRQLDVSQGYLPTHIRIMGLTGFKLGEYGTDTAALEVYIDMLDRFDSRIKAPGVFRLELYEYVPRSSNPRGKRIMIWDDIDLTDAAANNEFWRDFLRCYQFNLPIVKMPPPADPYILEATCITLEGKQLTTMFHLTGNQQP